MGHGTGFGYALWAIAQGLVIAMGCSEGFGSALWVVAQHLVMRYGPLRKTNYHSAELDNSF
jgi:type IV secretory pathway TrbD component